MKYTNRNKNKKTRKLQPIFFVCILLITLAILGGFYYKSTKNSVNEANEVNTEGQINLSPPTEEEKNEVEKTKQKIVEKNEALQQNPERPKDLSVTITSANSTSVYAQVSGIIEDGGVCTATFTKGQVNIKGKSNSISNVSYTQCAPIKPASSLSPGKWKLVVTYESSTGTASSDPYNIEVK